MPPKFQGAGGTIVGCSNKYGLPSHACIANRKGFFSAASNLGVRQAAMRIIKQATLLSYAHPLLLNHYARYGRHSRVADDDLYPRGAQDSGGT